MICWFCRVRVTELSVCLSKFVWNWLSSCPQMPVRLWVDVYEVRSLPVSLVFYTTIQLHRSYCNSLHLRVAVRWLHLLSFRCAWLWCLGNRMPVFCHVMCDACFVSHNMRFDMSGSLHFHAISLWSTHCIRLLSDLVSNVVKISNLGSNVCEYVSEWVHLYSSSEQHVKYAASR